MKKKIEKKYKRRRIFGVLAIVALVIFVIGLVFINGNKEDKKVEYKEANLVFEDGVNKIQEFNSGEYYKYGWLQVQGTHINLPILDSSTTTSDLNYSFAWLSPYYSTGDNRKVIAGHNIINVSNEPLLPDANMMNFEELMAFAYHSFAKNNLYIQYSNETNDVYVIYAIGFYNYDSKYDGVSLTDKKETNKYINYVRKNSIYDYDVDVNGDDDLIQLKTCTRMFGANENQQFVIDARKLRNNERPLMYSVKKTKKYDELGLKEEKM